MPSQSGASSPATAIATAITRMHRDHYGRGATRARTIIHGDVVAVVMEDIYTPVERTLLDAGKEETVRTTRHEFQMAMRTTFSDAVEQVMGRRVIAFMSQVHFNPDMGVELFVLAPAAADEPETVEEAE
ncbi:MAG TPA: DUF2294 domain-containing protein [Gaiellaceae bacterium]